MILIEQDAKRLLMERLDECLKVHADMLDAQNIGSIYELQGLSELHYYLKVEHVFTPAEVEALLSFQDPLDVARWCWEENNHEHSFPICDLLKEIDAEQKFEHFTSEPSAQDKYTLLMKRLGQNYFAYRESLMSRDKESLIEKAAEITAMQEAYSYLTTKFEFGDEMLDDVLALENPLKYFADRWLMPVSDVFDVDMDIRENIAGIRDSQEYLCQRGPAVSVLARLQNASYSVQNVKKRVTRKHPAPPFITSTLQQDASYRLGFQSKRTMKVAQELYEGVEVADLGAIGLITYMRTDSLRISAEAQQAASDYVMEQYGKEYLPEQPRVYKSKKNAQDAHEAIRPSVPSLTPARVKVSLTADQYKLYKLIWERFIASQMADALLDTVSVDIEADNCIFKATGSTVKFEGFTVLYDEAKNEKGENKNLPELEKGMEIKVKSLEGNQHFTQAPPRYTEATLIKALEENGIGRPSTYAPTITTITSHLYVEREGKQLKPTVLGEVTTELMKEHFPNILDVKFTAEMENNLDDVERGNKSWVATLEDFYGDFSKTLETAEEKMEGKRVKVPDEETDVVCDQCGRNMVIKIGRFGRFLACPGFPECKNTKKIVQETAGSCPLCGEKIILKKSKRGRSFYGCSAYPDCNFMTWNVPTEEKCPQCGCTLFQKGGKSGTLVCEKPDCGYSRPVGGGA